MDTYSKIILIGEHSVVYGGKAIAIPLKNINVNTKINKCDFLTIKSEHYNGLIENFKDESFYNSITNSLKYINKENDTFEIEIQSQIPISSGLGSSAAVNISIIKAIFNHYKINLDDDTLFNLAINAENIAHQNSSGLDITICIKEKKYIYSKKEKEIFDFNLDAYLLIIDSGIKGKTKEAVNIVKINYDQKKIDSLNNLVEETIEEIKCKNLTQIGVNFKKAHKILKSFNITHPKIDKLVDEANKYSLGSKMSGGGLGGCLISLVKTEQEAKKLKEILLKKGAEKIWIEKI